MGKRLEDAQRKKRLAELRTSNGEDPENEQLKDSVRVFRDSLLAAAERPDAFWARQRAAIAGNLRQHAPASILKPVLLWVPVSAIILMCFFLFRETPKLPAPDFAVGADQNLLVDVEQALYRDYPEALAPAATLMQEVR
jgi:hypothetical protein